MEAASESRLDPMPDELCGLSVELTGDADLAALEDDEDVTGLLEGDTSAMWAVDGDTSVMWAVERGLDWGEAHEFSMAILSLMLEA